VTSVAAELLEILWGRASTAPVSSSQLRVLFILEHNEGINMRTLADSLGAAPSSVSRLCDRLEAVGFVERAPSSNSRRELQPHLSSRGRGFLADLRARREQELRAIVAQMPVTKRAALLDGLEAFCDVGFSRVHAVRGPRDASEAETA
jgi:DNA-binding MarR family transcriptional regulator